MSQRYHPASPSVADAVPGHVLPRLLTYSALAAFAAVCAALAVGVLRQQYAALVATATVPAATPSLGMSPQVYAACVVGIEAVAALGAFAVAALIALRRANDRMALFVAAMLVAFGAALPGSGYALVFTQPIWAVPGGWVQAVGWLLLLPFALLFPDGRFVPSWGRFVLPLWALWVAGFFLLAGSLAADAPLLFLLTFLVWVGWLGAGVLAQVHRYRAVMSPLQRQQTKWVVLGFALAIPGLGLGVVPHILALTLGHPVITGAAFLLAALGIFCVAALLIPLALGIAVLRYRLFDVDLLINRTLVYGSLTTLLAALYGGAIALLQLLVRSLTGQTSDLAIVVSTLGIAALVQPLRQRVRRVIDRRFYWRHYNAERTIAAFGETLRHEVDLESLTGSLVAITERTMQPTHLSLWLRKSDEKKLDED